MSINVNKPSDLAKMISTGPLPVTKAKNESVQPKEASKLDGKDILKLTSAALMTGFTGSTIVALASETYANTAIKAITHTSTIGVIAASGLMAAGVATSGLIEDKDAAKAASLVTGALTGAVMMAAVVGPKPATMVIGAAIGSLGGMLGSTLVNSQK